MQAPRVTATRIVYENRWMRLHEDLTERADGTPGLYAWVEKPPAAVIVPVDDGHVWLVEQHRHPIGARFWELPQGAWEDDPAAAPEDLARGELAEETGLRAAHIEQYKYIGMPRAQIIKTRPQGAVVVAVGLNPLDKFTGMGSAQKLIAPHKPIVSAVLLTRTHRARSGSDHVARIRKKFDESRYNRCLTSSRWAGNDKDRALHNAILSDTV